MELFPAVVGSIGTWKYYATRMKPRPLSKTVSFAEKLWPNSQMDDALQRALNAGRAKTGIAKYLSRTPDRFFNSIVIAAMGGRPQFYSLKLADDPTMELLAGTDVEGAIGVLRFTSDVKYYALDGQHRLKAIQALLDGETEYSMPPDFENEEIPVIIVVQKEGEDRSTFLRKYRRLFGNLNRWAKPVDQATNIVLDEDDAFAIVTRRLLQDHAFFRRTEGDSFARIRCEGTKSMKDVEPFFMTIIGLYEFNEELLSSPKRCGKEEKEELKRFRLDEEELDELSRQLGAFWTSILTYIPELRTDATRMRTERATEIERDGEKCVPHLWFRPITQSLMAQLTRELINSVAVDQERPTANEIDRAARSVAAVPRLLYDAPYRHLLFVPSDTERTTWRMRSEQRKEAVEVALMVLRYITGLHPHDAEQLETLRTAWKDLLLNATSEEIEEMWQDVCKAAESFPSP
jgi:DNA sulfur modification protein DndB